MLQKGYVLEDIDVDSRENRNGRVIGLRVDASFEIGSGHTIRCLTLAKELRRNYGALCHFIVRRQAGHLIEVIHESGFAVHELPVSRSSAYGYHPMPPAHGSWLCGNWEIDAKDTKNILTQLNAEMLVVDHYALDARWETVVSESAQLRVCVIDDLADRPHNANILVDYTLNRKSSDYFSLVNNNCRLMTGLKYALLREEFSQSRQAPKLCDDAPLFVFINMGGMDKENRLVDILKGISLLNNQFQVALLIVVGKNYPHLDVIESYLMEHNMTFELFQNVNNISSIMRRSDIAISAVGTTAWELFSQGVPSILCAIAENQQGHLNNIVNLSLAGTLPSWRADEIASTIKAFILDREMRIEMAHRSFSVVDGGGVERVAQEFMRRDT